MRRQLLLWHLSLAVRQRIWVSLMVSSEANELLHWGAAEFFSAWAIIAQASYYLWIHETSL